MSNIGQKRVADAALKAARKILQRWYPNGIILGDEFCIGDIYGSKGRSLKFNLLTGIWKDFSNGSHTGRGIIALLAQKEGISFSKAAQRLAGEIGLGTGAGFSNDRPENSRIEEAVAPVPIDAQEPRLAVGSPHPSPKFADYLMTSWWRYLDGQGCLLFFTVRFDKAGQVTAERKPAKMVWPYSYHGGKGWRWRGWGRRYNPLYGLDKLFANPDAPVLLVEGEKTADATAILFPQHVVVTWLGGTGQLGKADFSPLQGRDVVYWPDADEHGLETVEPIAKKSKQAGVRKLRVVNLPPDLPLGWDLADEPPFGLDRLELVRTAGVPATGFEVLLRDLGSDELLMRLAYNVETDQFVDLVSGYRAQSAQVNALFRHRETGMATKLLADERLHKTQRLAYLPGNQNRIVQEKEGLEALNLWKPSHVVRRTGDATPFIAHLRYLCSSDEEFEHLANMLAFMVQRLGEKLMSAIVLVGPQGTGKSFVGHVMRELLGTHNTAEVTSTHIKSDFNQFMEAKLLVIVEEIMAMGRLEVMNTLKPYITQPTVTINAKHLRPYSIENLANFLFLSNFEDALKLEDKERRFFIVMKDGEPMPQEYYDRLWAWEKENRGIILDWLLSRDLSGFNPASRPPITEGKLRMVEASRDDTEVLIAELLERRAPPFEHDLVELSAVHLKIRDMSAGMSVTRPTLIRAMRANGAADLRQKKGMLDGIAVRASLWAVRDVDAYRKMPAQDIIEHFVIQGGTLAKGPRRQEPEIKF